MPAPRTAGRPARPDDDSGWITTGEAAVILGASVSTVRRLADQGALQCERNKPWSQQRTDSLGRKLNGYRRVTRESVLRLKAKHDKENARLAKENAKLAE